MKACQQLLEGHGGRVMVFGSNMCNKGVGSLKSRDKQAIYNKPEEKGLFVHTPEHDFYTKLGLDSVKHNVCFDVYLGVPQISKSIDIASIN